MGLGFSFGFGPFRVGGQLRGPGATDEEWAALIKGVFWIVIPVWIFQGVIALVTDPYFWFAMVVGCLPSIVLLFGHVRALDRATDLDPRWRRYEGRKVLLALPAAGYEILVFVWESDGFGFKRDDLAGLQLQATALYVLIMAGYLAMEFAWVYLSVRLVGNSVRNRELRFRSNAQLKPISHFDYDPKPPTQPTKTQREIAWENTSRELQHAADSAERRPEVWILREEISKVAQRREKMRQKLKNASETSSCPGCNEKLLIGQSDCFNCEYKELRQRLDALKGIPPVQSWYEARD